MQVRLIELTATCGLPPMTADLEEFIERNAEWLDEGHAEELRVAMESGDGFVVRNGEAECLVEPMAPRRIEKHCACCRGTDVSRQACVRWSSRLGDWEITTIYDDAECDECGETEIVNRYADNGEPVDAEVDLFANEEPGEWRDAYVVKREALARRQDRAFARLARAYDGWMRETRSANLCADDLLAELLERVEASSDPAEIEALETRCRWLRRYIRVWDRAAAILPEG